MHQVALRLLTQTCKVIFQVHVIILRIEISACTEYALPYTVNTVQSGMSTRTHTHTRDTQRQRVKLVSKATDRNNETCRR
ncbi:UNVERIFIED_CONTAM: hypothetical protein FKN15_012645 [Acipenser sinensis]